ncbi:MAG: hypothetical protein UT24_C0011G0035 [Candidatus Woesebacteria bacterium GW2011_GWB1_39_12]|uniref:Uncharacterized protein n=1 Tax=Candidatus Woesebacteria bacterium GW2011_GWB1_39_12 TaxID=1618574 RepID=A0A0G0QFS1_9BACT|nr:MAG: hypothetical protein UT24_C0011G0035 [Candidatus Woesebacteria bacterium GW2011_GWB1_39_12]
MKNCWNSEPFRRGLKIEQILAKFQGILILKSNGQIRTIVHRRKIDNLTEWSLGHSRNLLIVSSLLLDEQVKIAVTPLEKEFKFDSFEDFKQFLCNEIAETEEFLFQETTEYYKTLAANENTFVIAIA